MIPHVRAIKLDCLALLVSDIDTIIIDNANLDCLFSKVYNWVINDA